MLIVIAAALLGVSVAAILYHHIGYPLLLQLMARRRQGSTSQLARAVTSQPVLPTVTLIIPTQNQATAVVAKLANLATLDYPRNRLSVVVALDGCTDDTRAVVLASLPRLRDRLDIQLVEFRNRIGQAANLNARIAATRSDLVAISDASAAVNADALLRAVAHFADPSVGVVCGAYRVNATGSDGERAYWAYQTAIKANEAAVAAPMGAHGGLYLIRRDLWTPLPPDTLNDDFVMPMTIVARGYRAVYDASIMAVELERTKARNEFQRRVRTGAGNVQQLARMWRLADPRRGALAFVFLSGKALRLLIPLLALTAAVSAGVLAVAVPGPVFKIVFAVGAALAGAVGYCLRHPAAPQPVLLARLAYLVEGYAASGLGAVRYLSGQPLEAVPPVALSLPDQSWSFLSPEVSVGKRAFDIVLAFGALAAFAVLFIPIALAIKLESKGPIFYRQRRVGRATPDLTETFDLYKFRSMYQDAEARSGAVWATKNDPRVTRVGRFLRKSRLDELPQCFNVLRGDMSIIGPRPERPGFFSKLEDAVPFYVERTFGIRPGITGLAQVNLPYDADIEDVRMKCVYDHAYATRLTSFGEWLRTDIGIVAKTFQVMVLGKGQ